MFYGREYSAEDLRRHCGSSQQLARISRYVIEEGKEQGVRCLDFHTAGGLSFTVVASRGMDIAHAEYKGRNLSWLSPTGLVAPEYYDPQAWNWMRSFFGGLLTTCGLVNVGMPDVYKNEMIGAHGPISNTPATNVSHDLHWAGSDVYLLARGEMRETRPPHYNVTLRRRIQVRSGDKFLRVHDTVTNEGFERLPHQILYHVNAGFPIVTRTSYLISASRNITPRDEAANEAKEHYKLCSDPTPGYSEKVYFHDIVPCTDGRAWAAIVNPELDGGLGLYVKYRTQDLPHLVQWKMMGEGMYVVGLEPSNSYGIGMSRQQALGMLQYLEPGESRDYHIEIGVLEGAEEIAAFEREVSVVHPDQPMFASILV